MRLKCCSTAGRSVAPRATCGGGTCPRTTSGCWRRRSRFTAECPAAEYPPTAAAPSRRWPALRPASGGRLSLRWPAAPRLGPSPADRLLWPTRWSDRRFCGTAAIGPPAGTAGVKKQPSISSVHRPLRSDSDQSRLCRTSLVMQRTPRFPRAARRPRLGRPHLSDNSILLSC